MRSFSKDTNITVCYSSAGTGKTTFLTKLVEEAWFSGTPLDKIGFLTYSRAGAEVIKERVGEATGVGAHSTKLKNFCTIHSLAYRLNREQSLSMMTSPDYIRFSIDTGWPQSSNDWLEELQHIGVTLNHIPEICELYRNNSRMVEELFSNSVFTGEYLVKYMRDYNRWKKEHGKVDFTDLLENTFKLDMQPLGIDLLLLDEMQDSTLLQWKVLAHLFSDAKQVYIACDPKQSLYRFAGADPTVPTKLKAKAKILGKTYRLPKNILRVSDRIARLIKTVDYYASESVKDEDGVVDMLTSVEELPMVCKNDGKSVFLLAPSNYFLDKYIEVLERNAIPYTVKGQQKNGLSFKSLNAVKEWKTGDPIPEDFADKVPLFDFLCEAHKRGWDIMNPTVDLRTFHQSKGLEADKVVVAVDITRKMKTAYTKYEDDLHCMFYVGTSRAKHEMYILQPQTPLHYAGYGVLYEEVMNVRNDTLCCH